jgi:hypothetical protein
VIVPSKYLPPGRDLLSVGARIIEQLDEPLTVSELWERIRRSAAGAHLDTGYQWFVLGLSFAYAIRAVNYDRGVVSRRLEESE